MDMMCEMLLSRLIAASEYASNRFFTASSHVPSWARPAAHASLPWQCSEVYDIGMLHYCLASECPSGACTVQAVRQICFMQGQSAATFVCLETLLIRQ